jgi:hypothetical protein
MSLCDNLLWLYIRTTLLFEVLLFANFYTVQISQLDLLHFSFTSELGSERLMS